jgi:hypothetical protein
LPFSDTRSLALIGVEPPVTFVNTNWLAAVLLDPDVPIVSEPDVPVALEADLPPFSTHPVKVTFACFSALGVCSGEPLAAIVPACPAVPACPVPLCALAPIDIAAASTVAKKS